MKPTQEQQAALDLFATGRPLAIEAGAGTGKTATLVLLAESTRRRGQYVAFNKAIVIEAGGRMPPSIQCSTAHSLAFRAVGKKYAHRLKSPRMRSYEIANRLGIDPIGVTNFAGEWRMLSDSTLAGLVMRAVTRFCQSDALEPEARHVPIVEGLDAPRGGPLRSFPKNDEIRKALLPHVRRAWRDLSDLEGQLPYRHDHYLKSFHLSGPTIGAEYILFDEAQDASPVLLAIVEAQEHAQRVYVGDSCQAIYAFTGATNALERIRELGGGRAFLTRSFRFGPAVADVANRVLEDLEAELRLVGTPSIPSVVGRVDCPNVVLTRTNAEAVRCVLNGQRDGLRVHLVGGGQEVVSFARAAERLKRRERVDHPDLACFADWGEVREYVEEDAQGSELRLLVSLVDEFSVPVILRALERMPPEQHADRVVSTAHKCKGREWDAVKLAADFPDPESDEELRLLYVAVTRARLRLDVSAAPYFAHAGAQAA